MDATQDVVVWIADNVFSQVPILIGLITLAGLVAQRKAVEDVVGGTLRATVGVVVLLIGIDIFTGGLSSFQEIVSSAVGLDAPSADNTLNDFLAGAGSRVPLVIAFGFLLHLILVRIFPAARYVYLTGHLLFWMSVVVAATLVEAFGEVDAVPLVVVGSVVLACYWTLQPLWIAPLMRRVVGTSDFGLAHTTSVVNLAAGYGAKRLGDPEEHDTEKLKLPRQLSFFKDVTVSTALVIGVIMLVAMVFADHDVVAEQAAAYDESISPWAWGFIAALRFAAGIAILLYGVRMFLAEIVPAFKGISDKIIPNSRPALDVPTIFPKAPTAVMVGFLATTATFLVLMGVFAATGWFVLVPPMIMLFFGGGAAGAFGNAVAGWRGAVFGGVVNGFVLGFGQWIGWQLYSDTAPELATLADADWYAVGWLLMAAGEPLSAMPGGIWVLPAIVLAATVGVLLALGRRERRPTETVDADTAAAEEK
ncbi:PTS system ascorbate-specific IIC component [Haloactinopolyspora alba]|uniref:Ascorbate-specific PTS system EIIC component n=1 Tax=Haloactinopolyspora alba TaxID=648780 RepID=A0A2P8DPU0_9ACTN|nr:PTS ascorbate transporter subunit IIC [Haloactinopolyspora alba]PSK99214.1 PTS system ascorbate-specific IIC component [Haloactinopolyspora alba]